VKYCEGLSNSVSIISRRYIDKMQFAVYVAVSFITFIRISVSIFYHCMYGCMFCTPLFNFVSYVLLLLRLCILIVSFMYS
jgi:hypothetical protein